MIRKANFVLLAFLPLLAVIFILSNTRTGYADDPAPCPNVIGSSNVCPEGWEPVHASGTFYTSHVNTYDGVTWCCV